jgi:uncharacterized protein involved in outer membrane biogenesis
MPLAPTTRSRLLRIALIAAALAALYGAIAWFALPAAVRWAVEGPVSRELGRAVSVQGVSVNPYNLHVRVQGLKVAGAPGEAAPLLEVRDAAVNASWTSVVHLTPVIDALKIDGLRANLVRTGPQRFNFSDIVDRILAKPPAPKPTLFAVYNIELADGAIRLDDQVRQSVEQVDALTIGVPFVSNFPTDRDVHVQPRLAAKINGQPFDLQGRTLPFEESLDSVLDFKFEGFDIPHLLSFSPVALNFQVARGKLDAELSLTFRRAVPAKGDKPAQHERLILAGQTAVREFALKAPAGATAAPLIEFRWLAIKLEELGLLIHRARITEVRLEAPSIQLTRSAQGINWVEFLKAPVKPVAKTAAEPPAAPGKPPAAAPQWDWEVARIAVEGGRLHFVDDTVGRFERTLTEVAVQIDGLSSASKTPARLTAAMRSPEAESLAAQGELTVKPLAGKIGFQAEGAELRAASRYLAQVLDGEIEGRSSVSGQLAFAQTDAAFKLAIDELKVAGKDLRLSGPSGSGADLRIAALDIGGGRIDLGERRMEFGTVLVDRPRVDVLRLADGKIGWQRVFHLGGQAAPATGPGWKIKVGEARIEGGEIRFEDTSVEPAARLRATQLKLSARNLQPGTAERTELNLRTRLGRGSLATEGWATLAPLATRLTVDARNLDVAALRPYFAPFLNVSVKSAEASARGTAEFALPGEGAPPRYAYSGNARLTNVDVFAADGTTELLRWQALSAERIRLRSGTPLALGVGQVELSDFYARVILDTEGKLNLANLIRKPGEPAAAPAGDKAVPAAADAAAPAAPIEAASTAATPSASAANSAASAPASAVDPATRPKLEIGGIRLVRGNVNFSDNFIRPNYTANMTGLDGTISALSSDDAAAPAKVDVSGKIDGQAPVTVAGSVNPLTRQLALDLRGDAEGIDLPGLSPYSIKYAGYPIVKGKLSLGVHYVVADQKLQGSNKIFISQLTFGERIDSPTATKLPVTLAVALLKNAQGDIDISLPVSGSLSDPQFSFGGVIIKAIINLFVKAVTAPFTLLASAFGGGGEELGYVSFAAGSSRIEASQKDRLGTLARALTERPGLRLDIIGRADPALDLPGLREAKLEALLRAEYVKEVVRGGSTADVATVQIPADQRARLLAEVYDDTRIPDKPRNLIGMAKTIPPAEQEKLLLAALAPTPEDLRALANARAFAVQAYLEAEGKVARDRLFVVEPKLNAEGIKDGATTTRVDFSLK